MKISSFFKHIGLVIRHKNAVFKHCCRCGIIWRGLVHDLSKFTPTELFESAKYYTGYRSPIGVCRRETGMSLAWLHHKGVNKHHLEYWLDGDCEVQPLVPYQYAVECICDKIAATKIYKGKSYTPELTLEHWLRYGNRVDANPKTMKFIETAFADMVEHGEDYVLNPDYMKANYKRICLDNEEE